MSDNIKVVVKVRPLISRELEDKLPVQWRDINNTLYQLDSSGRERDFGHYTFDKVYGERTKTVDVYEDVAKPIVEAAVAGINGTIFAYGQTSSGKTFTMTGTEESPGIIPLAVFNLFDIIKNVPGRDFVVSVSYIEIYNEALRDLLDLNRKIKIQENYTHGVKVDASTKVTASPEEVLEAMKEGNVNRHTGATNMNESSSRSHTILQIIIESREHVEGEAETGCVNQSQLNLVDLAGSERAGQTGATGLRFKEGTSINKSLTTLALVIKQLSDDPNKYANYRDSKLTRILQNSLGGNAKTSIICAVTPAALEETVSTLQFATRAKSIKNKPEVNAVPTDATMIQSLTKQLSQLQSQLETKKNLEVMLESKKNVEQDLQNRIVTLKRFILNGFSQRPNVDLMGGARRKQLPSRRITISTATLEAIEEDTPKVPKFCTPTLKYNPSLINPADFVPIQKRGTLTSLPEEPPRLITPPPRERKVNSSGDVIDLDSDDDDDGVTCSPYHSCYGSTKTPPCILRKNAKHAEKNLKEIVELTDREKIYSPDVVELIQKLEQSTAKTAILQNEIELLKTASKKKDFELEMLKSKVTTTEEEIKSLNSVSLELETERKDFNVKLVDWEVSYETLKNKAKLREQELLSLLEEQRIKQVEDIDKLPVKFKEKDIIHLMDISKDISLVNSENESSIFHQEDDEHSERTNWFVTDMQNQLAEKNKTISELENNIHAQKEQIKHFEKSSHDLLGQVASYKEKLTYVENENELLQSTVSELNSTVKSLKENLELAQNDMSSYSTVIQELQIKLTTKENILESGYINDTVLENMLLNEDKTIANNENLKNIIHSFKLALEKSRKEIDLLKLKMVNNNKTADKDSNEDTNEKTKQIELLNDEIFKLNKQVSEHIVTINTLLREKEDLASIENKFVNLCKEQTSKIEQLKCDNEKLNTFLTEEENAKEVLGKKLQESTDKVLLLEKEIKTKENLITDLNTQNNEFNEHLIKAQQAIKKLQNVFLILTGDVREIPEILDSFVVIYNTLNENLNILESIAVETMSHKEFAEKNVIELQTNVSQYECQIAKLTNKTENLNKTVMDLTNEIKMLNDKNTEQSSEIEKILSDLNNKTILMNNMTAQLKISQADSNKHGEILEKDHIIVTFKENEILLTNKIEELKEEINQTLKAKEMDEQVFKDINDKLQQKCFELAQVKQTLEETEKRNDLFLENIVNKIVDVSYHIKDAKIDNLEDGDICDHILAILDAVVEQVTVQSSLGKQNIDLKSEIQIISGCNKSLKVDLKQSSELLQHIKEELKLKSEEIDNMKLKVIDWKTQFNSLDMTMKEQTKILQCDNQRLKTQYQKLHDEAQIKINLLSSENIEPYSEKAMPKHSPKRDFNVENLCPPSLLTICCNTIVEAMDPKQNDNMSETTSSSWTGNTYTKLTTNPCIECDKIAVELRAMQQENIRMFKMSEQLKIANKELLEEQSEIREQIRLLLEPSQELQKKIANHKTNLSILTATTYAENKSLKSQVKGLQHHHSRIHNVCQRDIPEFKKYLNELMVILKAESAFSNLHNSSFKRYSLPNFQESNCTGSQIRNESTFDSDMLMLDTNVTVTTADNTLIGYNQTCLDLTMFNETGCQTIDYHVTEPHVLSNQRNIINDEIMIAKLEILTEENTKLKEQMAKHISVSESKIDAQCSQEKVKSIEKESEKSLKLELNHLAKQLSFATKQKEEFEKKYNDLVLEMPSTDALVLKMKALEEQLQARVKELNKITDLFKTKNEELRALQDENDTLSTQVMEHISDIDNLNKEVEIIKKQNLELVEKCKSLELKSNINLKVDNDQELEPSSSEKNHSKLNRSLSDSDTTSRHNKICTLQSEIHAGREDCKVLTEDVATIKQHLDQTNISMDMDESINFELANESLPCSPQSKQYVMPDIKEKRTALYADDRNSCFNYYLEKTGTDKDNLPMNMKIIEVMKLFYNNLVTKHGNEVENLVNKLKDNQESQANLQLEINFLGRDFSKTKEDLEQKEKNLNLITNLVTQLRENLIRINTDVLKSNDSEVYNQISDILRDNFLSLLDTHFNLSSVNVFEQITSHTNKLSEDLEKLRERVTETSNKLFEKDKQCNLLMAQNEKIHEINNAVTLDIIKKEHETSTIIKETYQKLFELDMISPDNVPLTEPVDVRILIKLLEHFVNKYQEEKVKVDSMTKTKATVEEKERQLIELQNQVEMLQSINHKTSENLSEKDDKVIKLERSQEELSAALNTKFKENTLNLNVIAQLSEEITKLNKTIINKEQVISSLSDKNVKATELLHEVKSLQDDNEKLKAVNQMISKERESYASELEKSCATIKQNNADIDKMTSDILVLRESVNEATNLMEKLKKDIQALEEENVLVKQKLEIKTQDCSRLNTNIKTHEKSVEVQSRMIMRLQKQKEEDDENLKAINEVNTTLVKECEEFQNTVKTLQEEIENLKIEKKALENRLSEWEETGRKSRTSMDPADTSKRRRQSLHDSKRMFDNLEEHKNVEATFSSRQQHDLFMNIDDDISDRSTPFGNLKGRDSLLSRTDSDKDEEHPRPSSSLAKARLRRQSSHDLHRSVTPQATSPSDLSNYVINEIQELDMDISRRRLHSDNEIAQLREKLAAYERELEGLKERNRELDEECEICGEYIQERDQLIKRLKKEKTAIEKEVSALKLKSETHNFSFAMKSKPSVAHVSVNTDKDWANLHSVVVDRMSYNAEVEKNKKLTKTIEELRFNKLDLKKTIAKMQKALEKSTSKDYSRELEHTQQELKVCKEELKELRAKYKELDEECETCSEYLKEREEQCRLLKEAKTALETKLQELQDKAVEHSKSVRKKRQTVHDMNRPETSSAVDHTDVSTNTMEDFSSMSRVDSTQVATSETSRDVNIFEKRVEILSQQKAHLEQQLRMVQGAHPMFVATGSAIVQNQQITDVMKENQKLKKINAKLVTICKKRGKSANRENEDPCEQN